jgi:hypothetical protein
MTTPNTIDKSVLRITALLTTLLLLGGLFSMLKWTVLLLCADAFIRGFASPTLSPIYRAARAHTRLFRRKENPMDAAPHRFAAKLNGTLFALAALLAFCNLPAAANGLTQLMVLVAGLEAFAGISLGAKLYTRIHPAPNESTDH